MRFSTIIIMACMHLSALAQSSDAWLYRARKAYENGNFAEAIQYADSILTQTQYAEKAQRAGAYRIIALASIYAGNPSLADSMTARFLMDYPTYINLSNREPLEFRQVLSKFDFHPKLALLLYGGLGQNSVQLVNRYTIAGEVKKYNPGLTWDISLGVEYRPDQHWAFEMTGALAQYAHQVNYQPALYEVNVSEMQKSVAGRLWIRYYPTKSWSFSSGLAIDRLTSSYATFIRKDIAQGITDETEVDLQNLRNDTRPQFLMGSTFHYRTFFIGINTGIDLYSTNNKMNRYALPQALYSYSWVDDDFRFFYFRLLAGARYNLQFKSFRKK